MKQQRYQAKSGRDWIDECADTLNRWLEIQDEDEQV